MIVDTPAEAAELGLAPLLILRPVEAILDNAGLGEGPMSAEPLGDGHSNLTYLLTRSEARFVLRRPPRPPLAPSAHDVLREARILRALAGTVVRVPRVLLEHSSLEPLGVPFYVMEYISGAVLTDTLPAVLWPETQRQLIGQELVEALVELHSVSPPKEIRGSAGYLERQLRRFKNLWEHSKTREINSLDEVTRLLEKNVPTTLEMTVVHGDYRLGNAVFRRDAPASLLAILDWELATVGDPLADVGYLTATWVESGYSPGPLALSPLTSLAGFPDRNELVALYEERSGRTVSELGWYRALALWKAAIFLEGNYRRWRAGLSDDAFYKKMDVGVPRLVELARAELVSE